MLEITAHAPTREAAIAFLQAVNIATVDADDNIVPIAEVQITGLDGEWSVEGVAGCHWNMRFYGESEKTLLKDQPLMEVAGQIVTLPWPDDADIFDKTYILELCAGRAQLPIGPGGIEWKALADDPVPPGYQTPTGVRAFDPSLISTRANVWA